MRLLGALDPKAVRKPRKQTELRHGKAMEAAEAKFQKAFDRVKRCAIEAPFQRFGVELL